MAWERRDTEEFYRREEQTRGIQREKLRGCNHKQSLHLVGNFLVCTCGRKFIYRLKG